MSWDEYLKVQEAVYGTEARETVLLCGELYANGEDELLEKEFDFSKTIKNPYTKEL